MGIIEQGRAAAEAFNGESGSGFKNTGKLNAYECDGESFKGTKGCGSYIVTIDRHPGVTPFMLKCGNCGGFAHSKMYRVQPGLTPTHEWYRPDTIKDVPKSAYDHVAKGGLVLRPIGEDRWLHPAAPIDHVRELYAAKLEAERVPDIEAKLDRLIATLKAEQEKGGKA